MSMKEMTKAVRKTKRDEFADGSVVKWLSGGKYSYAAIKTPVGWYTTSMYDSYVPKVVNFTELVELVADPNVSEVFVATEWAKVE